MSEAILEALQELSPSALERAKRLALALHFMRAGMNRREARRLIEVRCKVNRIEAWRIVDRAADMAELQRSEDKT